MSASAEAVARLDLNNSPYKQGLAEASQAMDRFSASISGQMKHLGGAIAGAFAFDKIISGFERSIAQGAKIGELASRFGVSAESLQKIGNAANQSGASLEDVASAMNKLAKNAGSAIGGNEKLRQTFQEIGVSVDDLYKMTPEDLFMKLSRAVHDGSLGSRDFAVSMELAGKNAAVLMETLRGGPEEIDRISESMGVFSDDTVKSLKEAEDSLKRFDNMVMIAFGNVARYAVPAVETFQKVAEQVGFMLASAGAYFSGDGEASKLIDSAAAEAWKGKKKEAGVNRATGSGSGMSEGVDSEDIGRRSAKDPESSGMDAAYKLGAKFDNERLDYQRKDAQRIRDLNDARERAASEEPQKRFDAAIEKINQKVKIVGDLLNQKDNLEERIKEAVRQNVEAQGVVSGIAAGAGGSARGPGARKTSFEIGAEKAAQRAYEQETRAQTEKYREQVKKDLGGNADRNAVDREIANRMAEKSRQDAQYPFKKAEEAKTQKDNLEKYLQNVDKLLNQLTQYAHVT